MSTRDLAVGLSGDGMNTVIGDLFKNPTAQQKIFTGSITKPIDDLGDVTVTYAVIDPPQVSLVPPTGQQWEAAHKIDPNTPIPNAELFQLALPKSSFKMTSDGVPPLEATGAITVYSTFDLSANVLSLKPVAIALDESAFSPVDTLIVNAILIPKVLEMAQSMLGSIPVPALPPVGGVTFQDPVAAIIGQKSIALATTMASGSAPSLDGYAPPDMSFYVLADLALVNAVLGTLAVGQPVNGESKTGTDAWYAAASITGKVGSLSAMIAGPGLAVSAGLDDLSGYAELGGTGVGVTKAVLCPIGAAVDAIADPKDWDKVISSFDISYKPKPVDIPVSFAVATVKGKQMVEVSAGTIDKIEIVASPKWSGSVTGTVLAPAAAAVIDLLSAIFKGKIVNAILKKDGQNIPVFPVPDESRTVEGIKITLTVPNGAAATPYGSSAIVQTIGVSFS